MRTSEAERQAKKNYRERNPEKVKEWRKAANERKKEKRKTFKVETHQLKTALGSKKLWDIADRLGWYVNGQPDTSRLSRRLRQNRINYDLAVAITEAANLDPVDVGL